MDDLLELKDILGLSKSQNRLLTGFFPKQFIIIKGRFVNFNQSMS